MDELGIAEGDDELSLTLVLGAADEVGRALGVRLG